MVDNLKKESLFLRIEKVLAEISLLLLVLVIFIDVVLGAIFRLDINDYYAQHLVIWVTLLGATLVTHKGEHLSISLAEKIVPEKYHGLLKSITAYISIVVTTIVALSSVGLIFFGTDRPDDVIVPIEVFTFILPVAFLVMALRFFLYNSKGLWARLALSTAFIAGILFTLNDIFFIAQESVIRIYPDNLEVFEQLDSLIFTVTNLTSSLLDWLAVPLVIVLILSALIGTPIFVVLSGLAIVLFKSSGNSFLLDIPQSMYTILSGDVIPAVPLFTLVGFIMSEGKAGERLVKLFRALLGWLPGGLAIVIVLICAFFTTITGATGVTILALGGLLYSIMKQRQYKSDFSLGFLTSAGSNGLLFPPSLPVMMYGVAALVPIPDLFIAGLVPGFLMVGALGVMGVLHARKQKISKIPFEPKALLRPLLDALPELLLPLLIIIGIFSPLGLNIVGTAAIAVVYVLVVELVIHRDIPVKNLFRVMAKGLPIIGGILIIIAAAKGLNNFMVYEMIPQSFALWVEEVIKSKYLFLILLNIALLITGCFMDIFSAIFVVAPLVIELGAIFHIDPVHLGIIFLANLQLGYLTPPVGLNLFMASYRFQEPLPRIYKSVLPFFFVMLAVLLIITYVPVISADLGLFSPKLLNPVFTSK
ncbi:MAG: TRAP transporter large permease subunit [Spirochaetales bacterium]|nr:TRAP transporter large permease subunit [Spirochaetales bacterium]